MEKVEANLIEDLTSIKVPFTDTFIILDPDFGEYAVSSEGLIYQVLDFQPEFDANGGGAPRIVYHDGDYIYFNYAEDGNFIDFLRKNLDYPIDICPLDSYELYEVLLDYCSSEVNPTLRGFLEEISKEFVKNLEFKETISFDEQDYDKWIVAHSEYYESNEENPYADFVIKQHNSLDTDYELVGFENEQTREFFGGYDDFFDLSGDEIALLNGATLKVYLGGDLWEVDWYKKVSNY